MKLPQIQSKGKYQYNCFINWPFNLSIMVKEFLNTHHIVYMMNDPFKRGLDFWQIIRIKLQLMTGNANKKVLIIIQNILWSPKGDTMYERLLNMFWNTRLDLTHRNRGWIRVLLLMPLQLRRSPIAICLIASRNLNMSLIMCWVLTANYRWQYRIG